MKNAFKQRDLEAMIRRCLRSGLGLAISLMMLIGTAESVKANLTGAVFTTDLNCIQVNGNIYNTMQDVYLDGGPTKNGPSLPEGSYYVQVTTPNGDLLGSSVNAADPTPFVVDADGNVTCFQLWAVLLKASDGTSTGYDPTTNPGGEYKVWVSPESTFPNGDTKTDNFKVRNSCAAGDDCSGGPPTSAISGVKYLDSNGNGSQDAGEGGLEGWTINITGKLAPAMTSFTDSTTTDAAGNWSKVYPQGTTFTICEVQQSGYHQTGPLDGASSTNCSDLSAGEATAKSGCWSGTVGGTDECNLNFGNVAFQPLTITKTATPAFTRTFGWTITKCVDKTLVEQIGGTATFNYTVKVTKDSGTDSAWEVDGKITISNPNPFDVPVSGITDSLVDSNGNAEGNASCTPASTSGTAPAGSTLTVNYQCIFSAAPATLWETNTATANWDDGQGNTGTTDPAAVAAFNFSTPTTKVNDCVTVKDTFNGTTSTLGAPCDSATYTYSHTVNIPANNCLTYTNRAKIIETSQYADKSVKVCGPAKTGALTMGFWQNKNGGSIILGGASVAGVCKSGTWLRAYAPFQDLSATATCSQVSNYVYTIIKAANASGSSMNAMLKAQMLATALDVYFSDPALGGNKINAPAPIGGVNIDLTKICAMIDGSGGTGTCSGSYENASSAFGGATSLTVSGMLAYAASQAALATTANPLASPWYGQVKATQQLAKDAFDAINNGVAFSP